MLNICVVQGHSPSTTYTKNGLANEVHPIKDARTTLPQNNHEGNVVLKCGDFGMNVIDKNIFFASSFTSKYLKYSGRSDGQGTQSNVEKAM